MSKEIKINNQTFRLKNDKLQVARLTVSKDNHLIKVWYKACMSNGCKLVDMVKASIQLNNH